MDSYNRMQTVVIYPLTLADIYSDIVRKQTENASTVEMTLEDTMPCKPPKGLVYTTEVFSGYYCVSAWLLVVVAQLIDVRLAFCRPGRRFIKP